ncbi:MarR family winged helix-turn-helix transcriptional regulator [Acrocarpospora catenulata]|uniref:MarR family winged helix-turn-helix transcriptional regulator n=1 Tax=Acrocarpospora catenulata TaxID=2836182 RepID=UPI001BD98C74|nr:MarR family transcriptional regulator [Acrocarpospora catenulata]
MTAQVNADGQAEQPRHPQGLPIGLVLGGGSLLHQVGRELGTALERQLAPHGITAQQAALLLHAGRQASGPSQLMALLGTDTAGMTKLLDRLEDKGLLQRRRHPQDRRAVIIELTEQGSALVPVLPPIFGRVTGRLLTGFTADEVGQLTAMLQRMLTNLRTDPAADS